MAWALTGAGADERDTLASMLQDLPIAAHQVLAADKGYRSKTLEAALNAQGITLMRPATRNEKPRPGAAALKKVSQIIESV